MLRLLQQHRAMARALDQQQQGQEVAVDEPPRSPYQHGQLDVPAHRPRRVASKDGILEVDDNLSGVGIPSTDQDEPVASMTRAMSSLKIEPLTNTTDQSRTTANPTSSPVAE